LLDSIGGTETDQAAGLRRLFGTRAARVVAFVSGGEACGRTTLLLRTAAALAKAGEAVVIIDEHSGANNVCAVLGMKARHDLLDLVQGGCPLERLVQPVAPLLSVMSAARFAANVRRIDASAAGRLDAALRQLQEGSSFVLIDCATRNGRHLSPLALAAPHMAVVVAAQGAAITRAYSFIKRLAQERKRDGFHVAITRAGSEQKALAIFHNMRHTAREHLDVRLDYLGSARVPTADHLAGALQSRLLRNSEDGGLIGFLPSAGGAAFAATGLRHLASVSEPVN
jgi:flagellar biosynthesis protein FlhG